MNAFFAANMPSQIVLVVDNAPGHSLAAKLEEERRRTVEAALLERYAASISSDDDEDDSSWGDDETDFDEESTLASLSIASSTEIPTQPQSLLSPACRWLGTAITTNTSPRRRTSDGGDCAQPKLPQRKKSENSDTLNLSDNQRQTLLGLHQKSLTGTGSNCSSQKKDKRGSSSSSMLRMPTRSHGNKNPLAV